MGETFTWNGGNGDFSDSTQWTPVGVPGTTDVASFPNGGTVSGTGDVDQLTVSSTVGITASIDAVDIINSGIIALSGGTLTSTGELVDTGTLDVSSSGSLIASAGSADLANIKVDSGGVLGLDGSGTALDTTVGGVVVGDTGAGTITMSNSAAASLSSSDGTWASLVLGQNAGATGTMTMTGGASLSTGMGGLNIGYGGTGILALSGGATITANSGDMTSAAIVLGRASGGSGTLTLSGTGTALTANAGVNIGDAGNGTVGVSNGATFSATSSSGGAAIAVGGPHGGQGTMMVSGPNAMIVANTGGLEIGYNGSGQVTVSGGGTLQVTDTNIGIDIASLSGATGLLTVTGSGSAVTDVGSVQIGDGGDGTLDVMSGGTLTNGEDGDVGVNAGSTGTVTVDASTWDEQGVLVVGDGGSGTLTIQNGGSVDVGAFFNIGEQSGSDGTVTVTGNATTLTTTDALVVGYEGAGTLDISGGATVTTGDFGQLGGEPGSTGAVTVDGAGSLWDIATVLSVGTSGDGVMTVSNGATVISGGYTGVGISISDSDVGGDGTLTIESGSTMISASGWIGGSETDAFGDVDVRDSGTEWTVTGDLDIGDPGTGTVEVSNGASLGAGDIDIGNNDGSGTLILSDTGSLDAGAIYVGDSGDGTFDLTDGATYTSSSDLDVGIQAGAFGTLTLDGNGTSLTVDGTLTVGDAGDGELDISGGASLTVTDDLIEAAQDGSTATASISDPGIVLQVNGDWNIGQAGIATALVQNGITVGVDGNLVLGEQATGNGALTVSGADTSVTVGGTVTIGDAGTGAVTVQNGANLDAGSSDVTIADQSGSTGSLTVSGDDSEFDAGSLTAGGQGSATVLVDTKGALSVAADMKIGDEDGGSGNVTITDEESSLSVGGDLTVGGGGDGVLLDNGADVSVSGSSITVGDEASGAGTFTINAASLDFDGTITAGAQGNGLLIVQQGASISPDSITLGDQSGSIGELDADGSGTSVTSSDLTVGSAGQGTLKITDGAAVTTNGDATIADLASGVVSSATLDTAGSWNLTGDLTVGGSGIGTMLMQGGGQAAASGDVVLGDTGGSGELTVTGTATGGPNLAWGHTLTVGHAGSGTLIIENGASVAPTSGGVGAIEIGAAAGGAGTIAVTGATFDGSDLSIGEGGGSGLLQINAGGVVSVGTVDIGASGAVILASGSLLTDPLTLEAGGSLSGYGTVSGAITDDGGIAASGGVLDATGAVGGGGTLLIDPGATLDLGSTSASGLGLDFVTGGNETLLLGTPLGMQTPISGFRSSDIISFGTFTNVTSSFAAGTLDVFSHSSLIAALHFVGSYSAGDFTVSDSAGIVTVSTDLPCFLRGTHIATPDGERAVEELRAGDRVVTKEGPRAVRWVGQRRIDAAAHPEPERVWPIRIGRDAIAPGVPARDLLVSPDHALYLEGRLVPARLLINHATIRQDMRVSAIQYFHVELDRHGLLLSEGLWTESYLDTGNRGLFENGGGPLILHPDLSGQTAREARSCAPFACMPDSVAPIWRRLADRAAALGRTVRVRTGTDDPALHLMIGGLRVAPAFAASGRYVFVLPLGAGAARLISRSARPCDARPWIEDRRRLGVMVHRIAFGAPATTLPLDHPALADGWWAPERDRAALRRWTNGNAALPLPSGCATLEVMATGLGSYPEAARAA